jgi:4-hydroxy-2-oxovalerate aldolase
MSTKPVKILDDTLRDGMHPWKHQLTPDQMASIAKALDDVGVYCIEFGHGNGLGASSFQYGFSAADDIDYLKAVSQAVTHTKLSIIIIPGIGTRHELAVAREHGVHIARLATQITESDIAEQHIAMAKEMGFETHAVLPAALPLSIEDTLKYARQSESYGADVVYLLDGSGYFMPEQVFERVSAMRKHLDVEIGFHGHNNLQLAVANSKAAVEAGATYVDCCMKGFGAGAGNCPLEIFAAICERLGIDTGVDLYKAMDVATQELEPLMPGPITFDGDSLMLGHSGVYSSFLLFAKRVAQQYGVDARDVIKEIGRRGCTEGQENICIEVAYDLSRK